MIGLGLNIIKGNKPSGASFISEYQTVLSYATTQGYTLPSSPVQLAGNTFIQSLKDAGIWNNLIGVYLLKTDADRNFAKINIKNPGTYNLTEQGTPVFTSLAGFKGNATDGTLTTGFNGSTASNPLFTANDASFGAYVYTVGTLVNRSVANIESGRSFLQYVSSTVVRYNVNSTVFDLADHTVTNGLGFFQASRDSGNTYLFRNGVQVNTKASSSSQRNGDLKFIGTNADLGLSFAFFGAGLVSSATSFNSILTTYLGSI